MTKHGALMIGWILWLGVSLDPCRGSGTCTAMDTTWRALTRFQTEAACTQAAKQMTASVPTQTLRCLEEGQQP